MAVHAPRPDLGAGSLRVGRLTKAHGLKGGLKLELFTDRPESRFVAGAQFYLQVPQDSPWFGQSIRLRELRWFNGVPVGFFYEVADRTAAESITRAILWIDEATVDAGQEENAWYDQDLVGMTAQIGDDPVGEVVEVQHFPAQDLLAVKTAKGTVLVPFVQEIVPEVNVASKTVVLTPPEGLFE
jgi:16S rRNA processing protein RimM